MRPTVPTCRPASLVTTRLTISMKRAVASSASCRLSIGVVPAWFAKPSTVTSHQPMPTMPSDDADVDLLLFERPALLDVQLDVGRDVAALANGRFQAIGIAADERDAVARDLAAARRQRERGRLELSGHRAAADRAALLVLKHDDFDRMPQRDVALGERLRDLDRRERSDVAVVVAAVGHRVDVRSEEQRLARRVRAGAPSEDVPRRVDPHLETRGSHQARDVLAAQPIRRAVGQPRHAAVRVLAELGQLGKMTIDAIAIDGRAYLRGERAQPSVRPGRANEPSQSPCKLSSSHRVRVTQSPRRPCQNRRPPPLMITVSQLGKRYGDLVAVDDVSLTANAGEVFGLLGPNGAGKSTTIGCISGLLTPTSGRITVLGHDVVTDGHAARRQLGVVPQELALYEDLSARENLAYWGAAYGMRGDALKRRVLEVLERIGLADRAQEPVKRFSGGMKRRLNFGCGVVHQPKVLLLDEPTVGVDPQSRVRLLELVREEVATGTCVLYTTHYMEEAQDLCHRLAIIDHGKLLAMGTLDELRALIGERDLAAPLGTLRPASGAARARARRRRRGRVGRRAHAATRRRRRVATAAGDLHRARRRPAASCRRRRSVSRASRACSSSSPAGSCGSSRAFCSRPRSKDLGGGSRIPRRCSCGSACRS